MANGVQSPRADVLISFVLEYLSQKTTCHVDVVLDLTNKAERLKTKEDVEEWMVSVKLRLGSIGYKQMVASFNEEMKVDCGFEAITINRADSFIAKFDNICFIDI